MGKKASMWGGRFASGPDQMVREFSASEHYDRRLYAHDIRGSMAHAAMLRKIGVLSPGEESAIRKHLQAIEKDIAGGKFRWDAGLEDVHMNIESELTRRTPAGAKLHTGRSRNDQVATDFRLWMREEVDQTLSLLRELQKSLLTWAERDGHGVLPGYTHLQRGQPVLLGHHLLAYIEMLERDAGRFADAASRANVCPLGSGALAGSTLPLDREMVATALGFIDSRGLPRVSTNSLDAVSDRDFAVEFLSAAALLAVHLSRLSEDLILWSSAEFGFIRLGDAFTTGSSLMPQKKNPDVAELARGRTGRVVGNLVALLVTLKGLPLSYNRDLQEDKERVFDTADTISSTLRIFAAMLRDVHVHVSTCRQAASDPLLLATDLADELVRMGIAFRQAHHLVGHAVGRAEAMGVTLDRLPAAEWKKIHPKLIQASQLLAEPIEKRLDARRMTGAPSAAGLRREMARWKRQLHVKSPAPKKVSVTSTR